MFSNKVVFVKNSDDAYAITLQDVLDKGEEVIGDEGSKSVGAGKISKEQLGYSLNIQHPTERLLYNPARRLNLPAAIGRFVWMMAASDRLQDIAFYEEKVRFFSDDGISVPGSDYGRRMLQPNPGLNQLASIIARLRKDKFTRRAAISIYQPEDAVRDSTDIPCTFGLFYQIRKDQLHATTVMRSNNAFVLLPYNLFEFSLLAEVVANEIGVPLGTVTHFAVSMHIFKDNYKPAEEVVREYNGGIKTGAKMPLMPKDPSPVSQTRELVILESQLRHASAGVGSSNIEEWIQRGREKLNPYWQQFYYLLLLHTVSKSNKGDNLALQALKGVIDEPFLSYLPSNTFSKSSSRNASTHDPFELIPKEPLVIPIFSSRRMQSLEKQVERWEKENSRIVTRQQYSKLQHYFLERVAARDGDLEITTEEINSKISEILKD